MQVNEILTYLQDPNISDILRIMENDYKILDTTNTYVKVQVLHSIVQIPLELWTKACMARIV